MTETYEAYLSRMSDLDISPLPRDVWFRGEQRMAWVRRMEDLETPLTDEEVERLMVELRDANRSHEKYLVQIYAWAADCPHDTSALEAPQPYFVGDVPEHPDEDEHHKRDENGELFCILSPLGERCMCGGDWCDRLDELRTAAEDFWSTVEQGVRRG